MTTLQARTYVGEADLSLIADFLNLCEAYEKLDEGISVDELREEFGEPTFDPQHDLQLWQDTGGALVGMAQLWIPATGDPADGYLWFKVHPDHRDGMIDSEIIAWGHIRMREVGRERNAQVLLRSGARADRTERIALLEQHGFAIARYFLRMARPLDMPIPQPQLPAGFVIRPLAGTHEAAAWTEMFNQSFIDHWNHHDRTMDERLHWMTESFYQAELDLIAVAPDGTLAAFAFCSINPEENKRSGRNEGWVSLLGTRRGFRNQGLGRAILLAGMQRLKDAGVGTAILGVDADSLTGATRLYESVGFSSILTFNGYVKDVEPA